LPLLIRGFESVVRGIRTLEKPSSSIALIARNGEIFPTSSSARLARRIRGVGEERVGAAFAHAILEECEEENGGGGAALALLFSSALLRKAPTFLPELEFSSWARHVSDALPELDAQIIGRARPMNFASARTLLSQRIDLDADLVEAILKAVAYAGEHGTLTLMPSDSVHCTARYGAGLTLTEGWSSAHFEPEKEEIVLEGPRVVVVREPLRTVEDMLRILENVADTQRGVVLFSVHLESGALETLLLNVREGAFPGCAVTYHGPPHEADGWLQDLAALTGADVIDRRLGMDSSMARCGVARRIQIRADSTLLLPYPEDVDGRRGARATYLRSVANRSEAAYTRDRLYERAAQLEGGFATVEVGGTTPSVARARRSAAERAVRALRGALRTGYCAGSGRTLVQATRSLSNSAGGAENLFREAAWEVWSLEARQSRDVLEKTLDSETEKEARLVSTEEIRTALRAAVGAVTTMWRTGAIVRR
jgi:chaperonin GroEL